MVTFIQLKGGFGYFTNFGSVEEVRAAVRREEILEVWWFDSSGTRYKEHIWMQEEEIAFIRSESNDG